MFQPWYGWGNYQCFGKLAITDIHAHTYPSTFIYTITSLRITKSFNRRLIGFWLLAAIGFWINSHYINTWKYAIPITIGLVKWNFHCPKEACSLTVLNFSLIGQMNLLNQVEFLLLNVPAHMHVDCKSFGKRGVPLGIWTQMLHSPF